MTAIAGVPGRAAGTSLVTYKVGGREYPMKTVRTCKVCMSPYRFDVEEAVVAGRTYAKIVESLPEDHDLNVRNVKDHYYNGHMPLEVAASRQIVEERAARVGKRIEDSTDSLVDGVTLLNVTVQKVFEDIAAGRLQPEVADGIRAANILAQLGEYDDGGLDQQAFVEAFMVYHESAQDLMSPEQFEKFGQRLSQSPVLRALASRYDGDSVDGEVLSENFDNDS